MPNANTVRQQVAGTIQLTIAPLTNAVAGTTATAFSLNNNALTLAGGGVVPLSAGVTGLYQGTGRVLRVSATGYLTTGASETLTLALYEVPAAIVAAGLTNQSFTSWNLLATSTARAVNTTTASFSFDARLQLDSIGGLKGEFTDEINNLVDVYAATTAATGLVGEADLNFVLVATKSASNSADVVTLSEFRIDLE